MKKLSVIIPLYNVEDYVFQAAKSVASQAFSGMEVVLVDDGSRDNSLAVCKNNMPNMDIVEIKQGNMGLSSARNAGIMAANSEYVMFLDADDFILPDAIKNICAILEKENPDVLFGCYQCWTASDGLLPSKSYDYQPPRNAEQRTDYILSALPQPSWNAWRYVCRKELIVNKNIFFEPGILCEDVPWTVELLENADTISFLQEPFYAYYQHRPGSIMSSLNPKRLIDLNNIVSNLLSKYKNRPVLCRKLVWQSFFYINEYCTFDKRERKHIFESYVSVLPLYKYSPSPLHRAVGKFRNSFCLYILSVCLLTVKCLRRKWKGLVV